MEQLESRLLQEKYEIVSKIKKGGFGIIYYGFDRVFEKPVAIKAIDPVMLDDAKYVDLFLKEAKNAAKLSHNNIVHIYDLVKNEQGQYFIIMEFIKGYDLGQILRKCKEKNVTLPLDLTIFIIKEVCKALEYAHNKRDMITNKPLKLVHRDISPSNLLISLSGQVKLIDFGLANVRFKKEGKGSVTISGKVPYMAPEQVNGGVVDRRTDIFSLGTIFYEMVNGERLISITDPKDILHFFKKFKLDTNKFEENKLPTSIQSVIKKMLQKNAEERYFGANGVYLDLIEYLMANSHTVELSSELGEYVKELYKDEAAEEKVSSLPLKPGATSENIAKTPTDTKITEDETINEKFPSNGDDITDVPEKEKESETTQSDNLDKILSQIESDFTGKNKLGIVSKTAGEKDSVQVTEKPKPKIREKLDLTVPPFVETAEEDDDLKTVIDVIRLSAKTHQKTLIFAAVSFVVLLLIFMAFDFTFQITALGRKINNFIFPPAISVISVPPGAVLYLDDSRVPGTTPLSIPEIKPGTHRLTLTHSGFTPIDKSIQVPDKGRVKVAGMSSLDGKHEFLFRFKSQVELNSYPSGGTVYLNGIPYPQKTPTSFEWEAGKPLDIEMEHEGFGKISGLSLNTLEGNATIEDNRLWVFEKLNGTVNKYLIEGNFKKFISISTIPDDVTWYVDGSREPAGRDGVSNLLTLSFGKHDILFKKAGFNDKLISISVDQNVSKSLNVILDHPVRINAKEAGATDSTNLSARITKYVANGKVYQVNKETPCEISLPAVQTTIFLEKQGYGSSMLTVAPDDDKIIAVMSALAQDIEVLVHDALTGLPIVDANIFYQLSKVDQADVVEFGKTDSNGRCINSIQPGQYIFKVKKTGYHEKQIALITGNTGNKLEFKLIIQ